MATASATAITDSGIQPAAGFRIIGGSSTDRLTVDDIVAAVASLNLDATNGIVSQSDTTARTYILGGAVAPIALASGSTTTVLQFASGTDLSDWTAGDVVQIGAVDATISSVDDASDTMTLTAALTAAPASGTFVRPPFDTFAHLENCIFRLQNNVGADSSSLDRGNGTSKVILSDQCDLVVGTDLSGDPALNPGVTVRGENLSYAYYSYSPLLIATWAKMVCHGLIRIAGTANSRINLVNRNPSSIVRIMPISHGADPWIDSQTATSQSLSVNVDLAAEVAEIYAFTVSLVARQRLTPGGLQASSLSVPTWIVPPGRRPSFFTQSLDALTGAEMILEDVAARAVGSEDTTGIDLYYVDDATTGTFRLRRWGGPLAAADFKVGNDDGHCRVVVEQEVTVKFLSPAGAALTVAALIETAEYAIVWPVGPNGTPVVTDTDYGQSDTLAAGEEISVDVAVAVIAAGRRGASAPRGADSGTAITFVANVKLRYSCWLFGREILMEEAVTLEAEDTGRREIIAQLAEDPLVTSATAADVPDAAETFDDVYDLLHQYAVENEEATAYTVDAGVIDVGRRAVTFAASSESLAVSGTAMTIPCHDDGLDVGHSLFGIETTGTITINAGVSVHGELIDTTGKRVTVYGLPAAHDAVVGAWPKSQGVSDRSNIITASISSGAATRIQFTLAVDQEYYLVVDAVSYMRNEPVSFDTNLHRDLDGSMRKITDAAGNDLVPAASALTVAEAAEMALVNYDAENDRIEFGATAAHNEFSFKAVARAIEVGQSAAAALSHQHICLLSTGAFTFESGSVRKIRRKSGIATSLVPDLSAFQITQIGSDDLKDFVEFDQGAIIVDNGVPSVVSLSLSVDDVNIPQAKWDERMLAVPESTRQLYAAATQTVFDALMAAVPSATRDLYKGRGGGSGSAPTVAEIVTGIKEADFDSAEAGTQLLGAMLVDLQTAVDAIPTDAVDVGALTNADHGLAALKTLIDAAKTAVDAIPTDAVDVGALTNADHGLAALKTLIDAAKTAVDAIPTDAVDVGALTDASHGLAALKTLIDAAKTAVDGVPSAPAIVDAIKAVEVETGVSLVDALRITLAVLAGTTTLDEDSQSRDRVTYRRLVGSSPAVKVSLGDDDGEREHVEVV